MVFENLLDPVFSPLLSLDPVLGILVISIVITLISTLAYKYLTDQDKLRRLKKDMKKYQEKIKKLRNQPDKMMKVQQEMMGKNMELMKQSFKPTLYTLIPILIIFGWLNAHLAFHPLIPEEPFTVDLELESGTSGSVTFSSVPALAVHKDDGATKEIVDDKVSWVLKGAAGSYELIFDYKDFKVSKEIVITDQAGEYEQPEKVVNQDPFKKIIVGNKKITPLEGVPLIGNWGWLGVYILFSIVLSIGLRKLLNVA